MVFVLAALFIMTGCSPKIPPGSVTYELERIEPNDAGMSVDQITQFFISLDASDKTYVAQFKARGMPVFVSEKGTYEINGESITFNKSDGEALIATGLNYNTQDEIITIACLRRGSTDTYTAVFKRNDDFANPDGS